MESVFLGEGDSRFVVIALFPEEHDFADAVFQKEPLQPLWPFLQTAPVMESSRPLPKKPVPETQMDPQATMAHRFKFVRQLPVKPTVRTLEKEENFVQMQCSSWKIPVGGMLIPPGTEAA
jgi:hypothetical protein